MAAPRSTFYPGLASTARLHVAGVPVSVSLPAFLVMTFAAVFVGLAASLLGWTHPWLYILSAGPLYFVVWMIERIDPAIFWLLASWLRHILLSIIAGRVPGLRAVTRDPWGA